MKGNNKILDLLGISASLICAVHCVLPPVLIAFSAAGIIPFLEKPLLELIILSGALVFALLSLVPSFRNHKNPVPLFIAFVGFLSIGIGHIFHSHAFEIVFMLLGGVLLAVAHYRNWKLNASCDGYSFLSAS